MSIVWVVTVYFTSLYMSQSRKSHFSPRRAILNIWVIALFSPFSKFEKSINIRKIIKALSNLKKLKYMSNCNSRLHFV